MKFSRILVICALFSVLPTKAQWFKSKKKPKTTQASPTKKPTALPSIAEKQKA